MDKAITAAAIERLEAEKQRRIAEKIAKGEALLRPGTADTIVTGVPRSKAERPEAEEPKWPKRDAAGREIYYCEVERDANGREYEVYRDRPFLVIIRSRTYPCRTTAICGVGCLRRPEAGIGRQTAPVLTRKLLRSKAR